MRRLALILAPALALGLAGCGTVCNLVSWDDPKYGNVARHEVYGGVTQDAIGAVTSFREAFRPDPQATSLANAANSAGNLSMAAATVIVDLPLSLVADTLTLPVTVPEAMDRSSGAHLPRQPQQPPPASEPPPRQGQ